MRLTVVIPTLNEEEDLPRTLTSLTFADEILVIDSGSTDQTVAIARKAGARVIHHPFKNFSDTRNYGDAHAKNDYILSIDADVVVTKELAAEMSALSNEPAVYKIPRVNIIWGKPILHTDWGPKDDNHIRLYHRSLGKWGNLIHEQYQAKVAPLQLKNHLLHYNYNTVTEFIAKINSYSDLEVARRKKDQVKYSLARLISEPARDFTKRYFYKLGFLDGFHGLFLSLLQALYYLVVNIKLKYA